MASLLFYVCATLEITALMVYGQQTDAPIVPSLPPPPTFTPVINNMAYGLIGNTMSVGEHVHATIDCSQLINATIDDGFPNPTVRWYKNGIRLSNGTAANVIISQDEKFCIISSTLIAVGGQLGTDGTYTCEVCDNVTCKANRTILYVCEELSLMSPMADPVVFPAVISLTCGQDVTIPTIMGVPFLSISCAVVSGSGTLTREIYKDGVLINNSGFTILVMSPSNDVFGTYTFVVSSEGCGSAFAVSRIQGIPPDIDEGPFIPQPKDLMAGDMTVMIGTPAYVVDGSDVIIDCNVLNGTPPITITWLRNGVADPTRGNASNITVDDYHDGDVFTCRADNVVGFDIANTTITVSDKSVIVSIDDDLISTKEGVKLTIDCEPLIDASGISNPIIRWYKNDVILTNGSELNVEISQDERKAIITDTLMAVGGQLGTEGVYTCEVCNATLCNFKRSVTTEICDVPTLVPPSTLPVINPAFVSLTCGQDITLPSTIASFVIINCVIFNGSSPIVKEVFKDGNFISDTFPLTLTSLDNDDFFGTYTFKASVERCGSATAESKILSLVESPTDVRATVLSPRSVEVTWTLSSSPDVTGYLISYTTNASYTSGGSVTVNNDSTISLTGLEENTLYSITIQAINSDGRLSANSNKVSVTTHTDVPSSPPQNVMVTTVDSESLMVSWEPPIEIDHNGPLTGYIIQYIGVASNDTTIIHVDVNNRTSYVISGLVENVDYSVMVAAVNIIGPGPFSDPAVVGTSVENEYVFFSESMYSVKENAGPAQPVLVLSNPSSREFNVTVFDTDGSATGGSTIGGGVDYISGPYTVTFPAGVTSVPFNVSIIDDTVVEEKVKFTLHINSSSLPTDFTVGDPDQAIVTIVDDDNCSLTTVNGRINYNRKTKRTTFKFSSDGDSGVMYKCRLDKGGRFENCDAGRLTWKNLKKGRHSIYLKAFCIDNQIEKYSIMRKRYKFRIREDEFIRLYAH